MLRRGYIDGPFGQLHYRTAGEGVPLILSHQSPSSSDMFRAAYDLLAAKGIKAIGVDTPGFGNSDVPNPRPSVQDYAKMFAPVLDHFNLRAANFLGHHTGAANVTEFAVKNPARVTKLILNGPPLFTPEERAERNARPAGPIPIESDGSDLARRFQGRVAATPGWTRLDAMHKNFMQTLWAGDTFWYGHKAAYEYDATASFVQLKVPTLILTNTTDDIYHMAQRARTLRPDMGYVELIGGTHDIVDEQPQAWTNAVAAFLKSA
ncbi:MAG: alpha/beta hydrolase [Rhodospirillaceae bacterium]|nr:alpha/beta hydrolase [Rhodospirillaceae bacterium]